MIEVGNIVTLDNGTEYLILEELKVDKLIFGSETNNIDFKRTNTIQIMRFYDILKKNNVSVTIRKEFGGKISAACGQLRSKKEEL